jgi:hypothetical protein
MKTSQWNAAAWIETGLSRLITACNSVSSSAFPPIPGGTTSVLMATFSVQSITLIAVPEM